MSTRSVIAFGTSATDWKGRYHHSDGYPSGVGATLFARYNDFFARDLAAMEKYLITDHPGGWSNINDRNFAAAPGFVEYPNWPMKGNGKNRDIDYDAWQKLGPECYCHGDRAEGDNGFITYAGDDWGTEWAYVTLPSAHMLVLERRYLPQDYSHSYWFQVADVDLNGPEPNWRAMQGE